MNPLPISREPAIPETGWPHPRLGLQMRGGLRYYWATNIHHPNNLPPAESVLTPSHIYILVYDLLGESTFYI